MIERKNRTDVWEDEGGVKTAVKHTFCSPNLYLIGNILYLAQAIFYICIDAGTVTYCDDDPMNGTGQVLVDYSNYEENYLNRLYIGAAVIHLASVFPYFGMWLLEGWPIWHPIFFPEWFNLFEAALWTTSASMYPLLNDTLDYDPVYYQVIRLELAASCCTVVAGLGWCAQWWFTFPRKTVGRGYTLDDPDVWGLMTFVAAAVTYLVSSIQVNTGNYATSTYLWGDRLYLANAIIYIICNLRDGGWFWWSPTAGLWKFDDQFEEMELQERKDS